jgi:hypothetical protein
MTPEQKLLIGCAAPYPTAEQTAEIGRLLRLPLDWPEITAQAGRHGISQLLFHRVQRLGGTELPAAVEAELRQRFERAIRQNLFMTGELIRLISLLGRAGITAVPFKGPVLAEKLYGNLALRVFGDLDVLIHPRDRERVKALLTADGYQPHFHPDSAYQFVKASSKVVVEVHWEAISFGSGWLRKLKEKPLPTTLDYLSPRLRETTLAGKEIATLSPEDTLLILTMHGSKHWWSRLNWLADIAAVIHVYPAMDWEWILEQVNYWKIRRLVFLGLFLARELLEAKVPEEVWEQVSAEPEIRKLAGVVQSMFFVEQNFQTRYIKRPSYFRQIWDAKDERQTLYVDHLALYLELLGSLIKR